MSQGTEEPRKDRPSSTVAGLLRYTMAVIGPVGSAGAQFLLSLVMLHTMATPDFGRFSFLLIASQLSWGMWSALVCAPLPVLLASSTDAERLQWLRCLDATNALGAAAAFLSFGAIGMVLGESLASAAIFAAYATVSLLRWYARARAYALGTPLRTTASDVLYSVVLVTMIVLLGRSHISTLAVAWSILLAAAVAGMIPFGRRYLIAQFVRLSPFAVRSYRAIWTQHSRWSLFGVVTTEATANAHAYLVTLILGPAAFAPVAASALIVRPISVAMNALTEFERAQLARMIGAGRLDLAAGALRFFRLVLAAVWIATGAAIVILFLYFTRLVFPIRYSTDFLVTAAVLWMAVSAMRLWRTPDSALLQAAGAFEPLARASILSSGVSLVAVLALILLWGPLWSIGGILIGEAVFAFLIDSKARHWLRVPHRPEEVPSAIDEASRTEASIAPLPIG